MTTRRPIALVFLLALAGCVADYSLIEGGGSTRDGGDPGDGDGDTGGSGGSSHGSGGSSHGSGGSTGDCGGFACVTEGICTRGGQCSEISVAGTDQVDLLFMIDNSASMQDEQASLARELPKIIHRLTTGDQNGDGVQDFPAAKDLHLGVVSSDLGLPGVPNIEGCVGLGDDGKLQSQSSPQASGCSTAQFNPPFLRYNAGTGDDPQQLATDLSCIAMLGTDGCGFQQPLESVLKAVWPGSDPQIRFVSDPTTGFGMTGQAGPGFPNGDFIRQDSIIGIVLVTDSDDCSSSNLSHFVPASSDTGLNTRCYYEAQRAEPNNLFDIERYITAVQALRPGREAYVQFSAIVGVPPRLVTPEALSEFDFSVPNEVNAFYEGLLAAPEMLETIDDRGTSDPADDNLEPSCDRGIDARAYPPRRIVEVAKGFGRNGTVQSICQEDFGPAVDPIIDRIADKLGKPCLTIGEERRPDGTIACDVYWQLPLPSEAQAGAPTECDDRDFLISTSLTGGGGRAICRVPQVPVREDGNGIPQLASMDEGFYYDDFSPDIAECTFAPHARIEFTPEAQPPSGVQVVLDCDD